MALTLVTIATGHQLAPAPAASYARMCDGYGAVIPVTSAWRDPAEQARLRALYLRGEWPNYVAPVEKSKHPKGIAVDFAGARLWLSIHAPAYGWIATDPNEWWHREYDKARDTHLPAPVGNPTPTTLPDPLEEDDMKDAVIALYIYVLRRMPDPTGLAAALVDLHLGHKTLPQIELDLRASDEYRTMSAADRDERSAALGGIW